MNQDELRKLMMEFERKRAKLGLRAALPDDKRRRVWSEPLTKHELHVLEFMRAEVIITAEELAGAMDENLRDTRTVSYTHLTLPTKA